MATSILLLPAELRCHIAELLSDSPNSLAALARTHTTYQRDAEKALYHTLSIWALSDDSLKCMETLATNSEKAAFVRFLTVRYGRNDIKNQRLTSYLSTSLYNMHSLSDLRVKSLRGTKMTEDLDKILGQVHFRLQSLFCHSLINIPLVIKSQTELQIFGLYYPGKPRNFIKNFKRILNTLKELHNTQLFLPIIITLQREHCSLQFPDHISIFPAFYSVDRRATIHQVLAHSLCKDQGDYMLAKADKVNKLSIYLIDSSDMPSIFALAKDMAVIFPQIGWLNLWFERRCEIPLLREEFSFFSYLRDVNTGVWPNV